MSSTAMAPPLVAVPTIESTKAGMANALAGKAASMTNTVSGFFANLGLKFLSFADKMHVGGPVRWVATATRWTLNKLSFAVKPIEWVGPRNALGLLLTTVRGQRLFARLLIIGTWPIAATYRTTVIRLPRFVMTRFGERGTAVATEWNTRVSKYENRTRIYFKMFKDKVLLQIFGADKVWIRIASRYFTWRALFNVCRRFVPWAPLRFALNGLYLVAAALQTGRDVGLIKVDPESAATWRTATAASPDSKAPSERAGAAADAAATSPSPAKPEKVTPAHLAGKSAAARQGGSGGTQRGGSSSGK